MIVEILKTDERLGLRAGHWYKAQMYWVDPTQKITLLRRVTKDGNFREFKKNPGCNLYLSEIKMIKKRLNS